jgi:hypothetical protein
MTSEESNHSRWEKAMHKFIGVEPTSKTWVIWTIFALKAGFVPVSIIIGFIFINSVTAEPNIPILQIVAGVVEFIWTLLFFSPGRTLYSLLCAGCRVPGCAW